MAKSTSNDFTPEISVGSWMEDLIEKFPLKMIAMHIDR
jgi:hypothetical protein